MQYKQIHQPHQHISELKRKDRMLLSFLKWSEQALYNNWKLKNLFSIVDIFIECIDAERR